MHLELILLLSACRELEANVQSAEYENEEMEINLATLTKGILPGEEVIKIQMISSECQCFKAHYGAEWMTLRVITTTSGLSGDWTSVAELMTSVQLR